MDRRTALLVNDDAIAMDRASVKQPQEPMPGHGVADCIAQRYAESMTVQLVTRVPDSIADAVDHLVEAGVFASRSDAVRAGLEAVVDRERRQRIGNAIADGYRRIPQDQDELHWSDAATSAMIAEEPW